MDRLREVTYPDLEQALSGSEDTPPPIEADTPLDETPDITEITSENTSEITTKITHHQRNQTEHGGGVKGYNKSATAQRITKEDEDRTVKEELALALMEFVAPTFNQGKNFVRNLSDDQLDGLGAWLMLLKKDHARLSELKSVPGYLQTQVMKGQYPDQDGLDRVVRVCARAQERTATTGHRYAFHFYEGDNKNSSW